MRKCYYCVWVDIPRSCDGCQFGKLCDPAEPTPERSKKPPLGIKPRDIHDELRLREVRAAIARNMQAGWPVKPEWVEEYNDLIKRRGKSEETKA